jgi:hypothetical protein
MGVTPSIVIVVRMNCSPAVQMCFSVLPDMRLILPRAALSACHNFRIIVKNFESMTT